MDVCVCVCVCAYTSLSRYAPIISTCATVCFINIANRLSEIESAHCKSSMKMTNGFVAGLNVVTNLRNVFSNRVAASDGLMTGTGPFAPISRSKSGRNSMITPAFSPSAVSIFMRQLLR